MTVTTDYPIDVTPSILDVAALLRARTKDLNGVEVGTFTEDTRPTSTQLLTLIDRAVADVQAWLGSFPPPELAEAARMAAALETACLAELSYWPEQVQSNRSAYPEYKRLLDDKIEALREAVRDLAPATSTRIEVPWVDFIPDSAVPVEVVVPAEAA
jgi:hypothetical protein